ncbi:hypothetical protein Cadr_000030201 [Camelus dromedarius]|uniref:Uncharacterized protein n=1 Tax=Camelus dromedarius TaxID=9838 RepID=A0A5N4C035_CAMDR|nr:hypothetical protein Cadr_000030201 [Camelus dromedarius]
METEHLSATAVSLLQRKRSHSLDTHSSQGRMSLQDRVSLPGATLQESLPFFAHWLEQQGLRQIWDPWLQALLTGQQRKSTATFSHLWGLVGCEKRGWGLVLGFGVACDFHSPNLPLTGVPQLLTCILLLAVHVMPLFTEGPSTRRGQGVDLGRQSLGPREGRTGGAQGSCSTTLSDDAKRGRKALPDHFCVVELGAAPLHSYPGPVLCGVSFHSALQCSCCPNSQGRGSEFLRGPQRAGHTLLLARGPISASFTPSRPTTVACLPQPHWNLCHAKAFTSPKKRLQTFPCTAVFFCPGITQVRTLTVADEQGLYEGTVQSHIMHTHLSLVQPFGLKAGQPICISVPSDPLQCPSLGQEGQKSSRGLGSSGQTGLRGRFTKESDPHPPHPSSSLLRSHTPAGRTGMEARDS